jgi:hypothetical protein
MPMHFRILYLGPYHSFIHLLQPALLGSTAMSNVQYLQCYSVTYVVDLDELGCLYHRHATCITHT